MTEDERDQLKAEAKQAILLKNEAKMSTRAIAKDPSVQPSLRQLLPMDKCEEIAHDGYVRAVIQAQTDHEGRRIFNSVVQLRFDEATGEIVEDVHYELADDIRLNPVTQRATLRRSFTQVFGHLNRLKILDDDLRMVAVMTLEGVFREMNKRLRNRDRAA